MKSNAVKHEHSDFGPPERWKHHEFQVEETMQAGILRARCTTSTTIDRIYAGGGLTKSQFDAGQDFERDFHTARLAGNYAVMDPNRGGRSYGEMPDKVAVARKRINEAMGKVGKIGGSVLWHVVGCGDTLDKCAWRLNSSGGQFNKSTIKGILLGALDILSQK